VQHARTGTHHVEGVVEVGAVRLLGGPDSWLSTLDVLAVEIVASVAHLVAVVQRLGVLNVLLPVESLQ